MVTSHTHTHTSRSHLASSHTKIALRLSHSLSLSLTVDDASGHYTSGFFYGNNYWMGSLALCEAIYDGASSTSSSNGSSGNSSKDSSNKDSGSNGLPFAEAFSKAYSSVYNAPPPFVPGFYVLKLQLNETLPTQVVSKQGEPYQEGKKE